jgi:formylmethanofuran dehydrogenase subunit E
MEHIKCERCNEYFFHISDATPVTICINCERQLIKNYQEATK